MQKTGKAALIPLAVTALLIAATGIASLSSPGKPEPRDKPTHIRAVLELAAMADTSKALIIGYQYDLVQRFAADNRHLLRPKGEATLRQAQAEGAVVLIVSASIDNWVMPFFPSVQVMGTQIEVNDGRLTGRFLTRNCYGQEKVNRILECYPHREDYHLTAYGDSRGDQELLAFADESHYKPFRADEN